MRAMLKIQCGFLPPVTTISETQRLRVNMYRTTPGVALQTCVSHKRGRGQNPGWGGVAGSDRRLDQVNRARRLGFWAVAAVVAR